MFTRLLVGLDGSPQADVALEQAVDLARRFRATVVAAHVHEPGTECADGVMLERARLRIEAAGLKAEVVEAEGEADLLLADLARQSDVVLIGRRGVKTKGDALGPTAASVVRTAERCVIVCGGAPSPMRSCAVAFDGGETSRRALELAARFAGITGSTVHVIHASDDREAGLRVVGAAEAALSLQGAQFETHVEPGKPGQAMASAIKRLRCDCLFAGAHVRREGLLRPSAVLVSHAEEILRSIDLAVVIQP